MILLSKCSFDSFLLSYDEIVPYISKASFHIYPKSNYNIESQNTFTLKIVNIPLCSLSFYQFSFKFYFITIKDLLFCVILSYNLLIILRPILLVLLPLVNDIIFRKYSNSPSFEKYNEITIVSDFLYI